MGGRYFAAGAGGVDGVGGLDRVSARSGRGPAPAPGRRGLDVGRQRHVIHRQLVPALRLAQLLAERGSGRRPSGRIGGHRPLDQPADILGHPVRPQVRHRLGRQPQEMRHDLLTRAALESRMPGQRTEQRRPEPVDIRRRRRPDTAQQLRRGESGRAGDRVRRSLETAGDPRDPEVGELGFPVLGDQDVARLDITVQRPRPVRRLQRPADLHTQPQGRRPVQRPAPLDPLVQRALRVVLHHDVRAAGPGGPDLHHRDDVRVPGQPPHRPLLAQEPLQVVGVEVGGQHLDRNGPVQRRLLAPEHRAEPAPPDLLGVERTPPRPTRRGRPECQRPVRAAAASHPARTRPSQHRCSSRRCTRATAAASDRGPRARGPRRATGARSARTLRPQLLSVRTVRRDAMSVRSEPPANASASRDRLAASAFPQPHASVITIGR